MKKLYLVFQDYSSKPNHFIGSEELSVRAISANSAEEAFSLFNEDLGVDVNDYNGEEDHFIMEVSSLTAVKPTTIFSFEPLDIVCK